jgi:pimeloyl-ACP methyl ester carboxylesterase
VTASVLYFHGFASSPKGQKIAMLRELLPSAIELDTPDLNVPSFERLDFDSMVEVAMARARAVPPGVIVGSSLGAIVALEIVRRGINAPLVLIAPAVGVGDRWLTKLPAGDPIHVFNHAVNGEAPIHRAFFERLLEFTPESEPPATRVSIVMGRNDETVPFSLVRDVWEGWQRGIAPGSRFIEIAGGDHSLVAHVEVIAREITAFLREAP